MTREPNILGTPEAYTWATSKVTYKYNYVEAPCRVACWRTPTELHMWGLLNLLKIVHGALGLYESAIDESEPFLEVEAWIRSRDSKDS